MRAERLELEGHWCDHDLGLNLRATLGERTSSDVWFSGTLADGWRRPTGKPEFQLGSC